MRKVWSRIFLLCMACMICMSGLCLAKEEEKENWVQYYYKDSNNIFYVDTNSIKVREYEGRKYLDVKVRAKGEQEEWYYIVTRTVEVTYAKWHKVFDIENRKVLNLEWDNKYSTPKKGTRDISELGERGWDLHKYLFDEQLVSWVEQNYPSVINEIRTHNQSIPGAKTDVMGTTGGSSGGSLQDIVGDIEYEVLDSGAVKFSPRCLTPDHFDYIHDTYYIFKKPARFKDWPGTYMIGWMTDDGTMLIDFNGGFSSIFDYDPKTKLFTFYFWDYHNAFGNPVRDLFSGEPQIVDPNSGSYYDRRVRLIDKNAVYEERFMGDPLFKDGVPRTAFATTYKYMPYDAIPLKTTKLDLESSYFEVEFRYSDGENGLAMGRFDENKYVWLGEERRYWSDGDISSGVRFGYFDDMSFLVDMMRAFFAVNGKIGEVFCDVDYNWDHVGGIIVRVPESE